MAMIRSQLLRPDVVKTSPEQLHKIKDLYLQNYRNFLSLSKYAPGLKFTFKTRSAFTGRQLESDSIDAELHTCMFNYAVASMREAVYQDLKGEGLKSASKYF